MILPTRFLSDQGKVAVVAIHGRGDFSARIVYRASQNARRRQGATEWVFMFIWMLLNTFSGGLDDGGVLITKRPRSYFRRGLGNPVVRRSHIRRFAQAAEAIRFAIEDLPAECLLGAFLEVDERRYGNNEIRRLYESAEYPLIRHASQS
jgi:hypothetical protein